MCTISGAEAMFSCVDLRLHLAVRAVLLGRQMTTLYFYVTNYRNMQYREPEMRYPYNFCVVKQRKPVFIRVKGGCIC